MTREAHDVVPSPSPFSFPGGDFDRWRSAGWSFVVGGEVAGEAVSAGSPESRLARALTGYYYHPTTFVESPTYLKAFFEVSLSSLSFFSF